MYRRVHELDPNRPVHYEGITWHREFDDVTDIESGMYTHTDVVEKYRRTTPEALHHVRIHARNGQLGRRYRRIRRTGTLPHYQGGFIWDMIDQALWHPGESEGAPNTSLTVAHSANALRLRILR